MNDPIQEKAPGLQARGGSQVGDYFNTCHAHGQMSSINFRLSQTRHRVNALLAVWTATALFMAAAGIVGGLL